MARWGWGPRAYAPHQPRAAGDPNQLSGTCDAEHTYESSVGVQCADGSFERDRSGCTIAVFSGSATIGGVALSHAKGQWCASAPVTATYIVNTAVTKLSWSPSFEPCCGDASAAEIARWQDDIDNHENHHVQDANDIAAQANLFWSNRIVTACSKRKSGAEPALRAEIQKEVDAYRDGMVADFNARAAAYDSGPGLFPPLDCSKFVPKTSNSFCCNATCVQCGSCETVDPVTCECRGCHTCEFCDQGICTRYPCTPEVCWKPSDDPDAPPVGGFSGCCVYACQPGEFCDAVQGCHPA